MADILARSSSGSDSIRSMLLQSISSFCCALVQSRQFVRLEVEGFWLGLAVSTGLGLIIPPRFFFLCVYLAEEVATRESRAQ